MLKQRLRNWLGIQELSHKVALIDKRTRKIRAVKPKVSDPVPQAELPEEQEPEVKKGYNAPR